MGHRLRQALATLLIGIAPLALLEGGLRLAGWPTERVRTFSKLLNFDAEVWRSSVGVFRPDARTTVMWPPELAYTVQVNSLGLRGPEIARTPPPGRTRILALGDSMTFGYYLEEPDTWPARLEARLRAAGADVEVVNAGVGAWSIDSETQFLLERGLALEPDLVVVGYSVNDVEDLARGESRYEGQKRAVGSARGPLMRAVYTSAIFELQLRAHVALKHWRRQTFGDRRAREAAAADAPPAPAADAAAFEAQWKAYERWLERMHAALAARGIPLLVVYIPGAPHVLEGAPAGDEARLRALAAARGIHFASALDAFRADVVDALFHLPLDAHIGPEGADRVARVAADAIAGRDLTSVAGSGDRVLDDVLPEGMAQQEGVGPLVQ
jgi:lysophospholipase L1-like esterase